jgi:pilus assembly protein CpaE
MSGEIRVMTVEAEKTRGSLAKLIGRGAFTLAAEATFGQEAVTVARESYPDIVLLNVDEPLARSLRTIELLVVAFPNVGIVAIVPPNDRDVVRKAIRAGARDYLIQPAGRDDLQRAITAVHDAELKRQHLGQPEHRHSLESGDVIVVYGAKGGIGKTTVAVNLATALATESKLRVALVDLDVQMGDVALLLSLSTEHSLADAAANLERLEGGYLQGIVHAHESGLQVLPSPVNPEDAEPITREQVERIIEALAQTFDFVVVDTSHSLTDVTIAAIERATLTLLVTTRELPSLKRTKIALSLLRGSWDYPEERIKLVLNNPAGHKVISDDDVRAALEMPISWTVPFDLAVAQAVGAGKSCVEYRPASQFSRTLVDLARSVAGLAPARRGLFARIR